MNCPNCDATNAPDRDFCWRCNAELPKPEQKRNRQPRTLAGLPLWMWVALLVVFLSITLGQCALAPLAPV